MAYIKAHRAGWRNDKHAGQWEATLKTYAEPIIGALPVQAIDTALVMKVLEQGKHSARTAARWRGSCPIFAGRYVGRLRGQA
ncbi:MAG: phage integrase central domain-containing protein [Rhizomicrobium sp.]